MGRIGGRTFFFIVNLASGQGSTMTPVDYVPRIALARGRETMWPLQGTHHAEDSYDVINNRGVTREEGRDRVNRVLAQDRSARSQGDPRHIINGSLSQALS